MGSGIFAVDGEEWATHRKVASHLFSAKALQSKMEGVFVKHGLALNDILKEKAASGEVFDLQFLFTSLTFDTMCEIAFGKDSGALQDAAEGNKVGRRERNEGETRERPRGERPRRERPTRERPRPFRSTPSYEYTPCCTPVLYQSCSMVHRQLCVRAVCWASLSVNHLYRIDTNTFRCSLPLLPFTHLPLFLLCAFLLCPPLLCPPSPSPSLCPPRVAALPRRLR